MAINVVKSNVLVLKKVEGKRIIIGDGEVLEMMEVWKYLGMWYSKNDSNEEYITQRKLWEH